MATSTVCQRCGGKRYVELTKYSFQPIAAFDIPVALARGNRVYRCGTCNGVGHLSGPVLDARRVVVARPPEDVAND